VATRPPAAGSRGAVVVEGPSVFTGKMPVPGCWEQHPLLLTYRGEACYTKEIILDKTCNLKLDFKGISHTAKIYFDDELICEHYNAYTPFSAVVKNVMPGAYTLKVSADNSFSEKSALHIENDYYSYGGITRAVQLEIVPDLYIHRMELIPVYDGMNWSLKTKVHIYNLSGITQKVSLKCVIGNKNIEFGGFEVNGTKCIEKEFPCENVKEWNSRKPELYEVQMLLLQDNAIIDDLIDRAGFRTIKVHNKDILLNGKKIKIKGFNRHEDYAIVGCSIPFQLMVKDLELIGDMGANAVRTSHYPYDELFLDLCDEMGILVWEEHHSRGLSLAQMQNPNFERQCEECNREMVENHINHPCIIIWGLLNECASDTHDGRVMYQKQISQIKELDSSRPVTFASDRHIGNGHYDICLDLTDLISFNCYFGWYRNISAKEGFAKIYEWLKSIGQENKPIIMSEFGAGAIYGNREPTRVKWTEERQCDILRDNIECYLHNENITGGFIWQFSDVRVSESRWERRPRTKNNKGVVDEYRRPKMAYELVKMLFSSKEVHS
jgi:beta-glucuronidase